MSNILDALRKSEQERQIASGQTASMLYPAMLEQSRGRMVPVLQVAAVGLVAVVMALSWWLWLRSSPALDPGIPIPSEKKSVSIAQPVTVKTEPVMASMQKPETSAPLTPLVAPRVAPARPVHRLMAKNGDTPTPATTSKPVPSSAAVTGNAELPAEQLPKDLPVLAIAGYIRDEQGASLAMINDKLVREGEEVAPGVRLEKILGDSSIFSYKGNRFRR